MSDDLLIEWGVTTAVGFVFRPILEDLAKDFAKDKAIDYVRNCFGSVFSFVHVEPLQKTLGKALREFLQLIQNELFDCGLEKQEVNEWVEDINRLIHNEEFLQVIRLAFTESNSSVNADTLARTWNRLPNVHALPDEFSWSRIARRFSRVINHLREEDGVLRNILQAQAAHETANGVRGIVGIIPGFDVDVYGEALIERYSNLHFDTLDTTGAYYSGVKLWNVFIPQNVRECQEYYPQVLEIPKEHLRKMYERGVWSEANYDADEDLVKERRRAYLDQAPRPVIEVLDDDHNDRVVILGDPGSGKSSLVQFLALRWVKMDNSALRYSMPLPVIIELREYDRWNCSSGKSLIRFLHEAQTWHRLNQIDLNRILVETGKVIFLLDGLDEIFDTVRREQVINDIHRFSNDFPRARLVVTSRVIGYKPQRLTDARFRHYMLQDLNDTQIGNFIDHWHDETVRDDRDRQFKKDRLTQALVDSRSIRELAGNPLLLTMMAILNRNQELPRDRVQLYQQASRVLLHEWDTERALD